MYIYKTFNRRGQEDIKELFPITFDKNDMEYMKLYQNGQTYKQSHSKSPRQSPVSPASPARRSSPSKSPRKSPVGFASPARRSSPSKSPRISPVSRVSPRPDIFKETPVALTKKCKDDEIYNPATKRCIKKNGTTAKRLTNTLNNVPQTSWLTAITGITFHGDEILNPATNRYVKKTGKIGKQLLKQQASVFYMP